MKLKEFIKTAVMEISEAITEMQGEVQNGTIINPTLPQNPDCPSLAVGDDRRAIERLGFDIAVTVQKTVELEGSASVGIDVLGAMLDAQGSGTNENVSRLTFSIPVVLPSSPAKRNMGSAPERKEIQISNQQP